MTLNNKELYKWASILALITIFYNILEGLISVYFGIDDETIALLGFGIDSFVEVISGIGIWHMTQRIKQNGESTLDGFERRALRITGTSFYLLTAGLVVTATIGLYQGHRPETTFWGIIVALVSILSMWLLIHYKIKVGKGLNSHAILADAECTRVCIYLSVVLLLASVSYEFTGISAMDSVGALAIAWLSFKEGLESFEKARRELTYCSCGGENEKSEIC